MPLIEITFYIMTGIECLLLIPFTLNYRSLDKAGRWAYYYLISSAVFAVGSFVLAKVFHSNAWFMNVMHLAQFMILSFYYYLIIQNRLARQIVMLLMIPSLVLFFLDLFKLEGTHAFNSIFATIKTFLLLGYGMIFFLQLLFDENLIKGSIFINTLPDFWFNSGLFIYFCSSFLVSLAYNFLSRHYLQNNQDPVQTLGFTGGIIEIILFYIGLMKAKKQRP